MSGNYAASWIQNTEFSSALMGRTYIAIFTDPKHRIFCRLQFTKNFLIIGSENIEFLAESISLFSAILIYQEYIILRIRKKNFWSDPHDRDVMCN